MVLGPLSVIKTSFGNTPTVSEPGTANLVRGTILRPIAQSLPQVQSPFPIDVSRDALRNHPDSDLVNDLLHDIEHGIHIGFHHEFALDFSKSLFSYVKPYNRH